MNKFLKIIFLISIIFNANAQVSSLFEADTRWILLTNRIDRNEIVLTSYSPKKVKVNAMIMSFVGDSTITYDYESNPAYKVNTSVDFLDIDLEESKWKLNQENNTITLTIKGGYGTIDDFKFTREYSIDATNDGYILRKTGQLYYENLKLKPRVAAQPLPNYTPTNQPTYNNVVVIERKVPQQTSNTTTYQNPNDSARIASIPEYVPVKINYLEQNKDLLNHAKRWILMRNKIETGDIYLTAYDESKIRINNLVLSLDAGKVIYDYETDPKAKVCLGIDFLDIDTDETFWEYDAEKNIFTLTLKGGYAGIDDFKFKIDYFVEPFDDGFALRKVKEHYFNDFRKKSRR